MPFKSEAQRKKFAQMVKDGTMSQATFDEWDKMSAAKLPERVTPKGRPSTEMPFIKHIKKIK